MLNHFWAWRKLLCFSIQFLHSHGGQTRSALGDALFLRHPISNTSTFWVSSDEYIHPVHFLRIWRKPGRSKGQKTPKKWPFCHLFGMGVARWEMLGDFSFDWENDIQIHKFKLLWKVDRQCFPTSYCGPNLDIGKTCNSAVEVERRACTWHCEFDTLPKILQIRLSFHCYHDRWFFYPFNL